MNQKRIIVEFIFSPDPRNPNSRGDFLVRRCGGWKNFVDQYAEGAMNLGYDGMLLHLPFGRNIESNGKFEHPMQYDAAIDAADHYLTEEFEEAWRPFVDKHRKSNETGPVIAYMGKRTDDPTLIKYKEERRFGSLLWWDAMALNDVLNSDMDIIFDAAFGSIINEQPESCSTHKFIRWLQSEGIWCGIEAHPLKTQPWAFDLPCRTRLSSWKQAWAREKERLTGEIIMDPHVHPNSRKTVNEWISDLKNKVLQLDPSWSVLLNRGDLLVDNNIGVDSFILK